MGALGDWLLFQAQQGYLQKQREAAGNSIAQILGRGPEPVMGPNGQPLRIMQHDEPAQPLLGFGADQASPPAPPPGMATERPTGENVIDPGQGLLADPLNLGNRLKTVAALYAVGHPDATNMANQMLSQTYSDANQEKLQSTGLMADEKRQSTAIDAARKLQEDAQKFRAGETELERKDRIEAATVEAQRQMGRLAYSETEATKRQQLLFGNQWQQTAYQTAQKAQGEADFLSRGVNAATELQALIKQHGAWGSTGAIGNPSAAKQQALAFQLVQAVSGMGQAGDEASSKWADRASKIVGEPGEWKTLSTKEAQEKVQAVLEILQQAVISHQGRYRGLNLRYDLRAPPQTEELSPAMPGRNVAPPNTPYSGLGQTYPQAGAGAPQRPRPLLH